MEPILSLGEEGSFGQENVIELPTQINSTTMAQWQRHCSPEVIQAQILKLKALRIDKLNIDYKLVDRSNDDRPYMVSEDEDENEDDEKDGAITEANAGKNFVADADQDVSIRKQ